MYKKLHVQSEIKSYNGKKVHITISIIPDFREAVIELTRFEEKSTILSDGKVTIKDELIVCEETDTKKNRRVVRVSKNAHWVLMATKYKEDYVIYEIYITERTKIIKTSLGNEVDEEFNRFIEECKRTYSERKKNEKRLYFYDAIKDKQIGRAHV